VTASNIGGSGGDTEIAATGTATATATVMAVMVGSFRS
jgi:hypothetical protein